MPAVSASISRPGSKDAVTDPKAIRHLWRTRPGELIGVPTGAMSGVDVLDIDPRHGGRHWLAEHADRLPATRTHRTRGTGWHFLFACEKRLRSSESKIAPGVNVRASGGYVIWWPASGFAVDHPDRLAPWPAWLLALLLPPRPRAPSTPIAGSDRTCGPPSNRGVSASDRLPKAPATARRMRWLALSRPGRSVSGRW